MAESKKNEVAEVNNSAIRKENGELKASIESMQVQIDRLLASAGAGAPSKAEMKAARLKKAEAAKKAADKRDKESADLVAIQKYNRDGDLTRERSCAKVDVGDFEKQGWVLKK